MKNIELQLHLIETLDHVVARIEEMVTSSEALNQIGIDILKNDLRSLYKTVCEIEETELHPHENSVQRMKDSVSELKRKLERFSLENDFENDKQQRPSPGSGIFPAGFPPPSPEEGTRMPEPESRLQDEPPAFQPVVEGMEEMAENETSPGIGEASEENFSKTGEPIPESEGSAPEYTGTDQEDEETAPEPDPVPAPEMEAFPSESTRHDIAEEGTPDFPDESGLKGEETDPGNAATGQGLEETASASVPDEENASPVPEKAAFPEEIPLPEASSALFPEQQDISLQILEQEEPRPVFSLPKEESPAPESGASPEPALSEFFAREEDEPSSYVTELTAMVQAQVGEQDMSKVAVSSTAMPDEKIVNQVAKRSDIFNRLKETQKLSATDPRNTLKTLVEKMKSGRTVNDAHQATGNHVKSLIGLNEKFLFLNQLFRGNIKDYNELLQEIDLQGNQTEALGILESYRERYDWDPESHPFKALQNLIGKRFPER